jgi:hypothetical protein
MTTPSKAAYIDQVNKVQRESDKARILRVLVLCGPMNAHDISMATEPTLSRHTVLKRCSDLCDLGQIYPSGEKDGLTVWAICESAEQKFHAYQKRHKQKLLAFMKRGLKDFYNDLSPEVIADFTNKLNPLIIK